MNQERIQVKIIVLSNKKLKLDGENIMKRGSTIFTVDPKIEYYPLNGSPDILEYAFSDSNMEHIITKLQEMTPPSNADITLFVLDEPIEGNYLSRIISKNRIIVSYYQVKEMLHLADIPKENYLLILIYCYVLLLKTKGQGESLTDEDETLFSHNKTTGCIYDFCENKKDIIRLCSKPHLCKKTIRLLESRGVSHNDIANAKLELRRIRQPWFNSLWLLLLFVKTDRILSFIIAAIGYIILNVIVNIIGNLLNSLIQKIFTF